MEKAKPQWIQITIMVVSVLFVMLSTGWAANTDYLIIPGQSVGKTRIGMSKSEILKLLGKPTSRNEKHIEYRSKRNRDFVKIYFLNDRIAQIEFTSPSFKTADGITTANFNEGMHAGKFNKHKLQWRFINIRYVYKGNGLSFFKFNANSGDEDYPTINMGVVYKGIKPFEEPLYFDSEPNGGWTPMEGPEEW